MEGQGVAASPAPAAGRQGQPGAGAVVAAELTDPGEDRVTSVMAHSGEGQGPSGDDSHVMVTPGYPEASAQDAGVSPRGEQPPPESSAEHQPSQESTSEYQPSQSPPSPAPSQATESDKPDNVVGPDQDEAPTRDEITGHDQSAAAPEAQAGQLPPEDPAQPPQDLAQPEDAARPEDAVQPEDAARPEDVGAEPVSVAPPPAVAAAHVRVDARLLEAALLNLRKRIAAIPLVFEIAGVREPSKTERTKLLSQIDDYLCRGCGGQRHRSWWP